LQRILALADLESSCIC